MKAEGSSGSHGTPGSLAEVIGPSGRGGHWLPDSHSPITWRRIIWTVAQASLTRSCYLSVRHRGWCIISRRTRLKIGRGAKLNIPRGSFLFIGFANVNPTPCIIQLGRAAQLSVEGTININRGCRVYVNDGGHLSIGNRSYINDNSTITCFESISIGSSCAVSWNTNVLDANIHEIVAEERPRSRFQPVQIGDRVWVGTGATVLPGVTIGDGAIVAAGSVVTTDVPGATLAAGNPARIVRQNVSWRR